MGGGRSAWMNAWVSQCACLWQSVSSNGLVRCGLFSPCRFGGHCRGSVLQGWCTGMGLLPSRQLLRWSCLSWFFLLFFCLLRGRTMVVCCKVSRRRRPKRKTAHKRAQELPGVRGEQEEMALGKNQKRWDAGSTRRRSNVQPTRQPPFPVLIERSFHPPSPNITA